MHSNSLFNSFLCLSMLKYTYVKWGAENMTEREVYNTVKLALEQKRINADPFEVIKLISGELTKIEEAGYKKRESILIRFGEGEDDVFRGLFRMKPDSKEIEGELLILDYIKNGIVRVI